MEYAWTDSTTVLAWLSSTSIKFPEYIINRTQKILETIPNANWRYVASEDNPADCASRGILPTALISHNLWWTGPPWLQHPSEQWPTLISSQGVSSIEEGNTIALVTNLEDENTESTDDPDDIIASIFKTKSSYSAILRIIGYFVKWRTLSVQSHCPYLTVGHLRESTLICIRWSQNQMFSKEINAIKNNRALSYRSSISSLCPFIDENNILRVRGRLQNSDLPYSAKYPAIIHRHQIFSIRLVEYLHSTHLHPSITLLTSIVRQNYWIVGARYLIKKVTNDCMSCRRQRAAQVQQQMGHLPSYRVQSTRAFKETGIDYAGPITIRQNRGKNGKTSQAYIAIFVCMATKAIHIELVSDLTTDTFLAALKRFVSRRGLPANIYSDNGTNFVGASKELLQLQRLAVNSINNELIQYFLSSKGIQWHFNPPSAPHFGGLWESGVKSVKGHLKRVIGTTKLTFEELCTLLCQVEGLLNSRPLMPLHNTDPNNFEVLTPGHFLTGDAIVAVPEPSYTHLNMSTLSRWQFLQNMIQGFWNSWRHDYLTSLQQRPKWRTASNHFKIDDIVLIREDNAPPSCWPMGRIIQLHPGGDQLLRVVTLRTTKGIMKRPIIKLCLLLSESPRESSNSSAAD